MNSSAVKSHRPRMLRLAGAALAASPSDSGVAFDYRQTSLSRWRCLESDLGAELRQFAQNRSLSRLLEAWQACEELHFTSVDEELATHLAAGLTLRAEAAAAAGLGDATNYSALRLLNLDGGALRDAGALALAPALQLQPALRALHAHNNQVRDEGARALAESLEAHSTLSTLDLNSNFVGDGGAKAIARLLKGDSKAPALAELLLYDNRIGPHGARLLGEAAQQHPTLRLLHLNGNNVGDSGAKALAGAVKHARALDSLYLYSSNVGESGAKALLEALKTPKPIPLRALELGGNPRIKAETLAAIRARLGAPSDATPFDDAGRTGVFLASSADKGEL